MPPYIHDFAFTEEDNSQVRGRLELEQPLPYQIDNQGSGFYRPGRLILEGYSSLEVVLYHNPATQAFMYLRNAPPCPKPVRDHRHGPANRAVQPAGPVVPGRRTRQADRTSHAGYLPLARNAPHPAPYGQQNLAVFPIAREGLKYQVAEAIYDNFGLLLRRDRPRRPPRL